MCCKNENVLSCDRKSTVHQSIADGLFTPESQKVDFINVCPEWETLDFVIAEDGEIAL